MLDIITTASSSDHVTTTTITKRKRRPAGTPDPEAEVVSLSPKTLLESDRYVCEICGQGFQRDQNLQMHRRRHKVPWKLVKREVGDQAAAMKKRVFVCPEKSCLHHDPSHALGDLVGIKKHFRRKHSSVKQWACGRCSKAYAVQSDFKAHLKTCGTRGHSCDCGRVFSRVESFIEHQDNCTVRSTLQPEDINQTDQNPKSFSGVNTTASSSRTTSSTSPSSETNFRNIPTLPILELQLLPPSETIFNEDPPPEENNNFSLKLSIGTSSSSSLSSAMAEEARREAKRQIEIAEAEFGHAKRIRRQARVELEKAQLLREQATRKISSTLLEITCQACKHVQFQDQCVIGDETTSSLVMSYTDDGEEGE